MKIAVKTLLATMIFALCFFNSALATELGFKVGLDAAYNGEFDEIHNQYEEIKFNSALEPIGMPLSFFLIHENIKISYLHYEQYTVKGNPLSSRSQEVNRDKGTVLIRNDVFTVGYQHEWLLPWHDLVAYGGADVAMFKSVMNVEVSSFVTIGNDSSNTSNVSTLRSEPELSFGLVFTAGVKKYIENVFVSADIAYINKNINFERIPTYQEQVKVDISGFIFSLGTGVAF